jgi:branched-chain amino acid aminotransferase
MVSTGFFNYNGQLFSPDTKVFGTSNRAFRYGDGLFETLRMIDGNLMYFKFHMERLFKGMNTLKLHYHKSFDSDFIASEIFALARANKIYKNSRIRFSVFREDGGWYTPERNTFQYLIEIQGLEESSYVAEKGLIVDVYTDLRKDYTSISSLKTINALPYVLAGVYRKENQLDECVLLNQHNNIVESISSNIFLIKENKIYTPAITEGCIDGVMRKVVIDIIKKKKLQLLETKLPVELLEHSDEIFLTNTIKGIQSVVGIGNKRYFSKLSKELLAELN